jgi:two-component system, NarL family, nitrate/nitrite response regulator NarL
MGEHIPLLACGIRATLEQTGEWIVLEATDRGGIMEMAQQHTPACAILDGRLGTIDPLDLCWTLRQQVPEMGILILDPTPREERCFEFLLHGANAYELRSIEPALLVDSLCRASIGEYLIRDLGVVQPRVRRPLPCSMHPSVETGTPASQAATRPPLSKRQLEILHYIAQGADNKEIAAALHISDQTVKGHITALHKKLSVSGRNAAVMYALRHKWMTLEPQEHKAFP